MADKEKPPQIYEISPKWILFYQTINFFFCLAALLLSIACQNYIPFIAYFCFLFFTLFIQVINYSSHDKYNISFPTIYHPNLLSPKDFEVLEDQYQKVKNKINSCEISDKADTEKCQKFCDEIKSIIDSQIDLYTVCWYKKLLGVPQSSQVFEYSMNKTMTIKDASIAGQKLHEMDDKSDESESDISTAIDKSDKSCFPGSSNSENNICEKNSFHQNKAGEVKTNVSLTFDDHEKAAPEIVEEIKEHHVKTAPKQNRQTHKNESTTSADDYEQLKFQLAQMKEENSILKDSIEKLIASQNVI